MTFGVEVCYIVTPLVRQKQIMEKLVHHWQHGYGAHYNPDRGLALGTIKISESIAEMLEELGTGGKPLVVGTSSIERPEKKIGIAELKRLMRKDIQPMTLLFGTGWGLTDETVSICDRMLEPVQGVKGFNHLPLRVALGIILDRIFGERGGQDERDD